MTRTHCPPLSRAAFARLLGTMVLTSEDGPLTDAPNVVDGGSQGDVWNELCEQVPGVPGTCGGEDEECRSQNAWGPTKRDMDTQGRCQQAARPQALPASSSPQSSFLQVALKRSYSQEAGQVRAQGCSNTVTTKLALLGPAFEVDRSR